MALDRGGYGPRASRTTALVVAQKFFIVPVIFRPGPRRWAKFIGILAQQREGKGQQRERACAASSPLAVLLVQGRGLTANPRRSAGCSAPTAGRRSSAGRRPSRPLPAAGPPPGAAPSRPAPPATSQSPVHPCAPRGAEVACAAALCGCAHHPARRRPAPAHPASNKGPGAGLRAGQGTAQLTLLPAGIPLIPFLIISFIHSNENML